MRDYYVLTEFNVYYSVYRHVRDNAMWCIVTIQTYWLGPLFGGILAGILYDLVFAANASCDKAKSLLTEKDYDDSNFDEHGRRESGEKPVNDDTPLDPEKPQDSHTTDYGTMQ